MNDEMAVKQEPIPEDVRSSYENLAIEVAEAVVRTTFEAGLSAKWQELANERGGIFGQGADATQKAVDHMRVARSNGDMARSEMRGSGRVPPQHMAAFQVMVNGIVEGLREVLEVTLNEVRFP